jgi:hypothetical protein
MDDPETQRNRSRGLAESRYNVGTEAVQKIKDLRPP